MIYNKTRCNCIDNFTNLWQKVTFCASGAGAESESNFMKMLDANNAVLWIRRIEFNSDPAFNLIYGSGSREQNGFANLCGSGT
jgi:hypothetical protein